jgi:hypothetical protein
MEKQETKHETAPVSQNDENAKEVERDFNEDVCPDCGQVREEALNAAFEEPRAEDFLGRIGGYRRSDITAAYERNCVDVGGSDIDYYGDCEAIEEKYNAMIIDYFTKHPVAPTR